MSYYTQKRGFTLVETMVAVSILAIALVGPFVASSSALRGANYARDELVGVSLAQEGIEYVRSVRDNNYLAGRTWMHGFSSFSCYGASPSNYCVVDPTRGDFHSDTNAMQVSATSMASLVPLYLSTTNLYNQSASGTETRFRRGVKLVVRSATVVEVQVTVTWITNQHSYSTTVSDILTDWI